MGPSLHQWVRASTRNSEHTGHCLNVALYVGEHLVVAVRGDPKFPHASFKCTMCDCYFNDDFATKAHVKGRRHRLNYKKTYDPTLYVEPTKSMVSLCVCCKVPVFQYSPCTLEKGNGEEEAKSR